MEPPILVLAVAVFTLLGVAAGVVTGLAPGLHVNNVALLLLASRAAFEALVLAAFPSAGPEELIAILSSFVMGAVVGHSFLDFVPSVYLGAPEEKTALSVLPGHRLLLAGEGHVAVRLAARGGIAGVAAAVALLLPLRLFLGSPVDAYERAKGFIAFVLLGIASLLILSERARSVKTRSGEERRTGRAIDRGGSPPSSSWPPGSLDTRSSTRISSPRGTGSRSAAPPRTSAR